MGEQKKRVDELSEALIKRGYLVEGIHGDIPQAKREQVIRRFKDQTIDIMVATDVAARGLDISGVSHVYNFDIPQDPESYVHRIGRTGRAGKKGIAITFVTPRELDHLRAIESVTKKKITRKPVPTFSEVLAGSQQAAVELVMKTAEEGDYKEYKTIAENLLEETDSVSLLAAALKLLTKEPDQTPIRLTAVEPLRSKKPRQEKDRNRNWDRDRNRRPDRGRRRSRTRP